MARVYVCPIKELKLSRIAISECESMIFAAGGCRSNGFYIVCWGYNDGRLLRVIRRKFSFPHEGDLVINKMHIFRTNRNSIDVFSMLSGEHLQGITLRKPKQCVEKATILHSFQNKDCLAISTNNKSFYIYAFEDDKYKLIYDVEPMQTQKGTYMLFFQPDLAEEGLLQMIYEAGETVISFCDLNKKILFNLPLKDEFKCGILNSKRSPWKNQLSFIVGFESGYLRVINITKNEQ